MTKKKNKNLNDIKYKRYKIGSNDVVKVELELS